ncbi:TPA: sulfite exporter TauE/SafE family protein [Photobacterium damselae]|uniref:sulfite exporter TauE/SafE family protein n=1 Tax=Photobacterium damselae TaxID=38293 RepID=UPI001244BF55|nr:sulfite exporter TauE/SafE family protein [Photobacterium damselae]KAB1176488.1 sulfite exporter TauE/SafE family protein [Photobacterium damselae subsp. damselae]MBF7098951.1 sulfite exporter TauE/SafE family protein [Photobacterium damselae]
MDSSIFLACLAIFTLGCFVQSSIGFGMGVLVGPFILVLEPQLMPSAVIFLGMSMSLIVWYQYRAYFEPKMLFSAFIGRLPGTVLAAYILMIVTADQLAIMLGVTVLIAVVLSLGKWKLSPTPVNMLIAGFVSGVMGTATGIGGPPLAILLQNEEPEKIRANLAAFFAITGVISLIALHLSGNFSYQDFHNSVLLLPAPIMATLLAYQVRHKIKKRLVHNSVLVLCSVSAFVSLSRGMHLFHFL